MKREFIICDVFARRRFEGNQLAVFPDAAGMSDEEMQTLAREIHFSETTFILSDRHNERGWPVRIFTPAREVPFAGHPTLGTAFVIWDRFLGRKAEEVRLDLKVGVVPVAVEEKGERLVMTQVSPVFGSKVEPEAAARVLGLAPSDIDSRFPVQEVSTGLAFVIVPVKTLARMQGIKVNLAEYYRLTDQLEAKAVLAFSPETLDPQCRLHVRVFCDYYDVPEDPATGSANGCLCAWLVRHRYLGASEFAIQTEQGVEMSAPRKVCLVQPVRIRSERRLAAGSELNPAPDRVTGHREARGMGYRATTQVKGLSPEILVIPVADAFHVAAGNTLRIRYARGGETGGV